MRLSKSRNFDVIVAGAGIAGIRAAIKAAEAGCSVLLLSGGPIFSGSSFYPGTWGLGLIGPENPADEEDLVQSILRVGCGMADEKLVHSFVSGIEPAISEIEERGIRLKEAKEQNEKDFIPCFDHKHRAWHGILFESAKEVFSKQLTELAVEQMPFSELLELTKRDGQITGGVVYQKGKGIRWFGCKALVLATGGYGGLFKRRLTTDDVAGTGQWLSLQCGCTLINMEFMQMMPGYVAPCPDTIFNEKAFRFCRLYGREGNDLLKNSVNQQEVLAERSTHGPFTSRLSSREVDFALEQEGEAQVEYRPEIRDHMPEFIKTYFDWLWEQKHLTIDDKVQISMFAHAANGGIRIREDASTEVEGLFACGEVTGGMHGADRIGGLSTANGLVFGGRAGKSAADYAKKFGPDPTKYHPFDLWEIPKREIIRKGMRETMTGAGMVIRDGKALADGVETLDALIKRCVPKATTDAQAAAASRRLWGQLHLAKGILQAELFRSESRGSHYRKDFPQTSANFDRRIEVCLRDGGIRVGFER